MSAKTSLVDLAWLQKNKDAPNVRVVEVDVDTDLYEKGHIPGALAWNWTTELNDPVRRDVASREQFEKLLSRSGITPETTVVLYGDNNNWFAAFGVWLLEYYGHPDARLLDGGRRKYEAERLPWSAERPRITPTSYKIARVRSEVRAKRDDVLGRPPTSALVDAAGGTPRTATNVATFVDVRSPDEYSGKILAPPGMTETAQRGGHIPGAANVPWSQAVREDGTFKPVEELRKVYAAVRPGQEAITYCRIGERSSHTWFALKHVLGHESVRNYDGSWTEYGNLIGAPIAIGPEP